MAIVDSDAIEISVVSGRSVSPVVIFEPGKPANPFSVGMAGEWRIAAEGVAPVHFFLAFDGREVHAAAAAPHTVVLVAGVPIGQQWARVPVPSEVRFAGAHLVVRRAPAKGSAEMPVDTAQDGGALFRAAERAVAAAQRAVSKVDDPGAPAPFAESPKPNLFGTMMMPNRPHLPTSVAPPQAAPAPRTAPRTDPPPARPSPGAADGPRRNLQSAPPVRPATPVPGQQEPPEQEPAKPDNGVKAFWKTASPVKKASLVMAPLALALSYWMLQDPPPPPPPRAMPHPSASLETGKGAGVPGETATATPGDAAGASPAPKTASATPTATTTGSAPTTATTTAPTTSTTTADVAPRPAAQPPFTPGRRTPERQGLDAVAAGQFDDATRRYDALAAAHPDDPAYREAARILREKAARPR